MATALIGYTGLVGGTLLRQTAFDDLYNSRNIEAIAGKSYDLVVCAGAPAQKWLANREPENDCRCLGRLMEALGQARAEQVVLISTVDVLPAPVGGVTEDVAIDVAAQQPYGKHRYELERFAAARFPTLVVRLPGLFGTGLKKNIIYDFLHHNEVSKIHADSSFQFYALERLWADLQTVRRHGLGLVHFATEPVTVGEVAAEAFGLTFDNRPPSPPARYDFRSKYAPLFGGAGGYLYSRAQVLDALRRYVHSERKVSGATGDLEPGVAA